MIAVLNLSENKFEACGTSKGVLASNYSDDSSYHSACEIIFDSKSIASSTCGLSRSSSSSQQSANLSSPNSEIVRKISISQKVNDAIFKPGKVCSNLIIHILLNACVH